MKVIRGRADEAGIAVRESAIERGYGPEGEEWMMIDGDDEHPLCEECVTALERGQ
jgi:hypothetical protein